MQGFMGTEAYLAHKKRRVPKLDDPAPPAIRVHSGFTSAPTSGPRLYYHGRHPVTERMRRAADLGGYGRDCGQLRRMLAFMIRHHSDGAGADHERICSCLACHRGYCLRESRGGSISLSNCFESICFVLLTRLLMVPRGQSNSRATS